MRTINQGVSVLLTFGSSSSSHLYCGVYLPENNQDYYNKNATTLKVVTSHIKVSVIGQELKITNIML